MNRCVSLAAAVALSLSNVSASAERVNGDFGLQLGIPVDQGSLVALAAEGADAHQFSIQPPAPRAPFVDYVVTLSAQQRVATIRARSAPMEKTACYRAYRDASKQLRARHPDSGYYALDDGDMYYDGSRQVVVACDIDGDMGRLVVEYTEQPAE